MLVAGRGTFQANTARNSETNTADGQGPSKQGGVKLERRILHSVIDKVYRWGNLEAASRSVISNRGSAGVDRVSTELWESRRSQNLAFLRHKLMRDRYRSKPVKRVYIPKPGSKKERPLGIPVVRDRVCQQAVCQVLSPVFEAYFHPSSHGFRPKRSTRTAARELEQMRRGGYGHVADLDIMGFFDQVDHEVLMGLVRQVVKDRRVLGLIRGWLKAGVMEEGNVRYQTSGTPQGGVISPLLSNVYLNVLDQALSKAGYRFVRYADDVVIACRTRDEVQEALAYTREVLRELKLELNEEKTAVTSFREGFDFLGFHFGRRSRGVGAKSLKGFYRKMRELTQRRQGDIPVETVIQRLTSRLRGWGEYHRDGANVGLFTRLDKWVRKRLRSYIYKRWLSHQFRSGGSRPSREEFACMGLFSLRKMLRPDAIQQKLF